MPPIRLFIADDHTLFRRGLISLLMESGEFAVVGEAQSGPEAVRLAAELRPDVVLLDVHMPGGGGVEATRRLRHDLPATPILMLTVSENDNDLIGAIRAGAHGYLLKNAETDELFSAIRRAAMGQTVIDPALLEVLFQHVAHPASAQPVSPLTLRETGILQLIAAGHTNREIATRLNLSENTIKTHIAHILEKLNAASRNEAVGLAHRNGWITSTP